MITRRNFGQFERVVDVDVASPERAVAFFERKIAYRAPVAVVIQAGLFMGVRVPEGCESRPGWRGTAKEAEGGFRQEAGPAPWGGRSPR